MPTAAEFRSAKATVEDAVTEIAKYGRDITGVAGATGFSGGTLPTKLDGYIDDVRAKQDDAVRLGNQVADELERRAVVCDDYHAELAQWQNRLNAAGDDEARKAIEQERPYPSESWVE